MKKLNNSNIKICEYIYIHIICKRKLLFWESSKNYEKQKNVTSKKLLCSYHFYHSKNIDWNILNIYTYKF